MSSSTQWVDTKLPAALAERAEKIGRKHGYSSLMEFVRDSVRRRLEELERLENSEEG